MNIADQARAIVTAFDWVSKYNGTVFVASDYTRMWKWAASTSQGPRVFVVYGGEESRGDFNVMAPLGRVDRQWTVALVRGRGFASERGDTLTETVQNSTAFYDLIDSARDTIRGMMLDAETTERPVDFKSIRPMSLGDTLFDGYLIEFSIGSQLPMMLAEPEDTSALPEST